MKEPLSSCISAVIETIRKAGWFPIAVFLTHEFCAHVIDGYSRWPWVDIPMHFFGGCAIAFFFAGIVAVFERRNLIRPPDTLIFIALIFGLTCATAVFWEFAEWTSDRMLHTHCQLDLDDTIGDLLNGILGGLAFIVINALQTRKVIS